MKRHLVTTLALVVAAVGVAAAPSAAAGKSDGGSEPKAICQQGSADDPIDTDGFLDLSYAQLDFDCDQGTWSAYVETFDGWDFDEMVGLTATLDTDDNSGTGCNGYDYYISHDGTFTGGVVVRTPTCDGGTWSLVSTDVGLGASALENAWIVWPASAIGNPRGTVRGFVTLESIYGTVDVAPDGSDIVVPGATSFWNGRCTIPYDETATNNSVARLYRAYFLRDADQGGLNYWVPRYRSGELCLTEISDYFSQSQEFVSTYGYLDNPHFVRLVYVNVLGREPDADGYNYWAYQITYGGVTRGEMMVGFSESPEFRSITGLA